MRQWHLPQLHPAAFLNSSETEGHWVDLKWFFYSVFDTKTSSAGEGCGDLELCYLRHQAAAAVGSVAAIHFKAQEKQTVRKGDGAQAGGSREPHGAGSVPSEWRIDPWLPSALGLPPCAE